MKTIYDFGAYTGFAFVYDLFMDNIPYDSWCTYLKSLLEQYHIKSGIIAELGCGTGNITKRLSNYGYDMIGIDCSEDMLSIAREKMMEEYDMMEKPPILYLMQDMRELELYGTVAAFISVCDSMNYLLEEKDLLQVFQVVNNYLDPSGIFIFDLKTEAYFERLGENTFAENREMASFFWENNYHKETKINEYDLTVYISENLLEDVEEEKEESNLFLRFDETHYQRAYSLEKIKELLEKAGMKFLAAYDAFSNHPPCADSERIYIVAQEQHQENKLYL